MPAQPSRSVTSPPEHKYTPNQTATRSAAMAAPIKVPKVPRDIRDRLIVSITKHHNEYRARYVPRTDSGPNDKPHRPTELFFEIKSLIGCLADIKPMRQRTLYLRYYTPIENAYDEYVKSIRDHFAIESKSVDVIDTSETMTRRSNSIFRSSLANLDAFLSNPALSPRPVPQLKKRVLPSGYGSDTASSAATQPKAEPSLHGAKKETYIIKPKPLSRNPIVNRQFDTKQVAAASIKEQRAQARTIAMSQQRGLYQ